MSSSPCLQALFEVEVDRDPGRVAVTCAGRHLTYGALDARANQLASHLAALGVGPGARVAVAVDRSLDLVVALLAVLKAGGAYVPLDPGHPSERLRSQIEDSGARLLVAQRGLSPSVAAGVRCVLLDEDAAAIAARPTGRPNVATSPSDLAYVIYTSGSTGQPKGVEVTHHNVARLFGVTRPLFGFGPEDVWSLCHATAFDFSVWEMFGALLHGGRLVVVPREIVREPRELAALLSTERVTMLSQTPSAFRQLAPEILSLREPPPLRAVVFGGEALEPAALRPWIGRFGDEAPRLVNMYGITEVTVHATYRRIRAADVDTPRGSPIGRALPDLGIELLDAEQRPVRTGEIGEIYVVGEGVARGYLGRPELTAERFVRLPASGQRAYRSGDLARALPDGDLLYEGRADQQVKIRGYRVEPGEIQRRLLESPGVADAAVVGRREASGVELVAYVVPRAGQRLSAARLRAELSRRVPSYLVPSAVVLLDRLPLTTNGKLDPAALPPPRREQAALRPPASPLERALCRGFARVLGLDEVGVDDRFVELGGQSLSAAQAAREISAELGLHVSAGALLSNRTVAELAARIDHAPRAPEPAGPPRSVAPVFDGPASAVELGLWLHAQRHPGDVAYNETLALVVPGPADAARIELCLADLAARHASLRTGLAWSAGALHRRVAPSVVVPLVVEDVGALAPEERAAAAQRRAEEQAAIPFDLAAPPLVRALLVRLGEQDHRLYLTVHHAVCDAPSLHNLAVDLSALHAARSLGRAPCLPPLPPCPAGAVGSEITGPPDPGAPPATLPVDAPRSAGMPADGAREPVHVPPALVASLGAAFAAEGATLFMVLLAAWHALLHAYGGADETHVGTVAAQRAHPDLAGIVGPLFTLLPVTAHPRGDQPFPSLLAEVRAGLLAALDAGRPAPLQGAPFETGFGLVPPAPRLAGGWEARLLEVGSGAAKHDLLLLLQEDEGGGLSGFLEYRAALRRADTVRRMAGHFVRLLESIAAGPSSRLSELSLLTGSERAELLAWGRAAAGDGAVTAPSACVHEAFLEQVQRAPEAIAVAWDGGSLSYAELAARAAAISAPLRARGVGPSRLCAVGLERSPDLVAALLGVLMAGGAFLPLDPAQPPARLAQLLADATPALVVTRSSLLDRFAGHGGPFICVDALEVAEASSPVASAPGDLAYVIYTSGSTGQPKGVLIEHRSLSGLSAAFQRAFGFGAPGRLLQLAPATFDVAVMEIFCTLASGATLVLPGGDGPLVGAELFRVLREQQITFAALPASLLPTLPAGELPALETLIVGGEPCPPETVDRWAVGRRLVNAYGPTEATVGATLAVCRPGQGKPPIGRPIGHAEAYVLDADRRLVPVGVPGELYLGGPCLARGYLNQPELTAARFVESPLSPGERLYRTGDRVRWRTDGQLDFIGRVDRQIKLRGFRVEPAEIEDALREHPGVEDAVVVAREEVPGHPTLCAYVVGPGPGQATPDGIEGRLRRSLRERLPDYLVPSFIVPLAALPLTPNGKVDLASLPSPRAPRGAPPADARRAGTLEGEVAAVWAEVLGLTQIGLDDSFFELGGTSLLLARVHARLEVALGRTLPVPVLFQHPTPRALAEYLRGSAADPAPVAAARAERIGRAFAAQRRPGRRLDHG